MTFHLWAQQLGPGPAFDRATAPVRWLFVPVPSGASATYEIVITDVAGHAHLREGRDFNHPEDLQPIADLDLRGRTGAKHLTGIKEARFRQAVRAGEYYRVELSATRVGKAPGLDTESVTVIGYDKTRVNPYSGDAPFLVGGTFVESGAMNPQPAGGTYGLAIEVSEFDVVDRKSFVVATGFAPAISNVPFMTATAKGRPLRAGASYTFSSFLIDNLGGRYLVRTDTPIRLHQIKITAQLTEMAVYDDLDYASSGEIDLFMTLKIASPITGGDRDLASIQSTHQFTVTDTSPTRVAGEFFPLPVAPDTQSWTLVWGPADEQDFIDKYVLLIDAREDDTGDIGFGGKYQHAADEDELYLPVGRAEDVAGTTIDTLNYWHKTLAFGFHGFYTIDYVPA